MTWGTDDHDYHGTWARGSIVRQDSRTWTSTISGRTDGASATNHTHPINYDGSSTDTEGRPDNYTYKVWKRIS